MKATGHFSDETSMQISHPGALDARLFKALYEQYAPMVLKVCKLYLGDGELAAEMLQELFCSLWERRDSLVVKGPVEHYLLRAARYQCIDYQKSAYARMQPEGDERLLQVASPVQTDGALHLKELDQHVGLLLGELPAQPRKAYQLSREEGLNHREIAAEMRISEKTVKNHLNRALSFLRKRLSEYLK